MHSSLTISPQRSSARPLTARSIGINALASHDRNSCLALNGTEFRCRRRTERRHINLDNTSWCHVMTITAAGEVTWSASPCQEVASQSRGCSLYRPDS